MEEIERELAEVESALAAKKSELAEVARGLSHVKAVVSRPSEEQALDRDERVLRAGAESYMSYDPDTAQAWLRDADTLAYKREALKNKVITDPLLDDVRSTYNSTMNYLTALTDRGAQPDDPRVLQAQQNLKQLGAYLRSRGVPVGVVEEEGGKAAGTGTPDPTNANLEEAIKEARAAVDRLVDRDNNGSPDNETEVLSEISDIARRTGINPNAPAWKDVLALVATKKSAIESNFVATEKGKDTALERRGKMTDQERKEFDYDVQTLLPGVDATYKSLGEANQKVVSILSMAKRNKQGASYITLKKELGDAISNGDFAGLMGKGVAEGLKSKFMGLVGASPTTEEEAKRIIESMLEAHNFNLAEYNRYILERSSGSTKHAAKIRTAYSIKPIDHQALLGGVDSAIKGGSSAPEAKKDMSKLSEAEINKRIDALLAKGGKK